MSTDHTNHIAALCVAVMAGLLVALVIFLWRGV